MAITINQVLDYIDTHPLCFHDGDFASVLDMLRTVYMESNAADIMEIQADFSSLRSVSEKLSPEERELLFQNVRSLCLQYEKTAFAHGIAIGLYLHTELSTLC